MGEAQMETDEQEAGQDAGSQLHDQAAALASEVRKLREGYEILVARIDEALRAGRTMGVTSEETPDGGEVASARELYLLSIAMSGSSREEAAAHFTEQFGGTADEELLDRVFESVPAPQTASPRGRFRRRQ